MAINPELPVKLFADYFHSLYDRTPFRWQVRLAERACSGDWPRFIKLPTSSGKTSCIDIAVFALAHQAWRRHSTKERIDAPRRILFVVDRRVIVNEAFQRAHHLKMKLAESLKQAGASLYPVAWWLRRLAGNDQAPPLDCFELRGGIYRDDAWVRSLLQPTVVTSTVDQVGSRLLFRGYGVSDRNLPIHAALTANDSLILLDEAHCSNPFSQTMAAIARYRDAGLPESAPARWAEQPLCAPFRFIEMTATPRASNAAEVFTLDDADYRADKPLDDRHGCTKPIRLKESTAKGGKQNLTLAKHLVEEAESLGKGKDEQPRCLRIAIIVNRVECARHAFALLRKEHGDRVELMIGRMRPIDRDGLTKVLQDRFKSGSEAALTEPHFIVATQCLEVGADFDFDGLVSQCANLDALRQRFGRLNRLGQTPHARGVIVMAEGDKAPRKPDPIYAESLPATWDWLTRQAKNDVIDFGIRSLEMAIAKSRAVDADEVDRLRAPALNAPVLMPAHLDLLCQTAPRPAVEPEIAPYLHGPNRGMPEVRICWRADLPVCEKGREIDWRKSCRQTLSVCPPSTAECLSVPLPQFKAWLQGEEDDHSEDTGDVLGEEITDDIETTAKSKRKNVLANRHGLIWNGRECQAVSGAVHELPALFPNALVVMPVTAGGWLSLGHVPDTPAEPSDAAGDLETSDASAEELQRLARIDEATDGFKQSRDRLILRVHPRLMTSIADRAALNGLWEFLDENRAWQHTALVNDEEFDANAEAVDSKELPEAGRAAGLLKIRAALSKCQAKQVQMIRYPGGFVVIGPRISPQVQLPRASFDDDFDEHNVEAGARVSLTDHLADVAAETERLASAVDLDAKLAQALVAAAERHDLGKADLRFQAMLLGSSLDMAAMQPKLWAKSARGINNSDAHSLPRGFRHEMLSLELARQVDHDLDPDNFDTMLHAIATHHGHARPFAPVVIDDTPPDVDLGNLFSPALTGFDIRLSSEERRRLPAHRLDSGISERFWKLNRRFGWWGLAWIESALRLADWVASAQPLERLKQRALKPAVDTHLQSSPPVLRLNCVGLNGANPLGFLAALGLFHHVATALDSAICLQWEVTGGNWSPTLVGSHPVLSGEDAVLDWLFASLRADPSKHWLRRLSELPDEQLGLCRPSEYSRIVDEAEWRDRVSADWMSCNGSDLCDAASNNQLQTARRDYFPDSAAAIITALTRLHLERTLFRQWDYADPIQKVSLHLEPREDRRHAYQWHKPVGDPTRALRGGMVGANRLAMEAWPLFQSVARRGELQTVGFQGTRPVKGITWTWPLWEAPLALCDVTPLLNLDELQRETDDRSALRERGISIAFRLRRILVEKTPNFTLPVAIFTGSLSHAGTI